MHGHVHGYYELHWLYLPWLLGQGDNFISCCAAQRAKNCTNTFANDTLPMSVNIYFDITLSLSELEGSTARQTIERVSHLQLFWTSLAVLALAPWVGWQFYFLLCCPKSQELHWHFCEWHSANVSEHLFRYHTIFKWTRRQYSPSDNRKGFTNFFLPLSFMFFNRLSLCYKTFFTTVSWRK
jgi:hypothetical protein